MSDTQITQASGPSLPSAIFGNVDDRIRVPYAAPNVYKSMGALTVTYPNNTYIVSGTLFGANGMYVLTAAHCIYETPAQGHNGFPSAATFTPFAGGNAIQVDQTALQSALVYDHDYRQAPVPTDRKMVVPQSYLFDLAVLKLKNSGGASQLTCDGSDLTKLDLSAQWPKVGPPPSPHPALPGGHHGSFRCRAIRRTNIPLYGRPVPQIRR